MRRFAMLILAGLMLAALMPMGATAGPEFWGRVTPSDIIITSLQGLVGRDTFVPDKDGVLQWKYDGYRFSGHLPPAISYTVDLDPLFGSDPTYYAVFSDDPCGSTDRNGVCIRVRVRLSRTATLTLAGLKPYLEGTQLKNAFVAFHRESALFRDIVIFPKNSN